MHASFVHDLAIVLGVAAVTGLIARRLGQPSVVGYLFAGLIVGPYVPIPLFADPERVHALSEFGVVLVMFAVGLEFRIAKLTRLLPVSGVTGLVQMFSMLYAGVTLGGWLGWSDTDSLFLGGSIAVSSTMVVTKVFEQSKIREDTRQVVFGVLVLQDVAAIAIIAVMTAVGSGESVEAGQVMGTLGELAGVLIAVIVAGLFLVPPIVRRVHALGSSEALVVFAVGLCFAFALLAVQVGYSVALGAFVAGVLVAESGLGHVVEHATKPLKDVFVAVFFVATGMTVDPLVAAQHVGPTMAVFGTVVVVQLVSVTIGGVLSGNGLRRSITAGAALGQIGEFAFIISAVGLSAGVVDAPLQPVLVSVALLSTLSTSLMLRLADPIVRGVHHALPGRLHSLLSLYEMWFEKLRAPSPKKRERSRLRAAVIAIALDTAVMAAIVIGVSVGRESLLAFAASHVGEARAPWALGAAAILATLPFFVILVVNAIRLAAAIAERVLTQNATDAARRWLRVLVVALVVTAVGIPLSVTLRFAAGLPYAFPAVLVAVVLIVAVAARIGGRLQRDVRSGAEAMLALVPTGLPSAHGESQGSLPGLERIARITLAADDHAIGQSLAELDLRARTGANVIAIQRDTDDGVAVPTGRETLKAADCLALAGTADSVRRAKELLRRGELADDEPESEGESEGEPTEKDADAESTRPDRHPDRHPDRPPEATD